MLNPDQARIRAFEVVPSLPEALAPLLEIAYNLWWTWHPEAVELFNRLDRNLWHQTNHNPVKMLGCCPQQVLDEAARDEGFLTTLARVQTNLNRHLERTPWLVKQKLDPGPPDIGPWIAYFSAEFGLAESLPIYSGGLGCLSGDHLKSAGELGMPLVGVGLLYRHGYFQQYLNAEGWQQEYYPDLDFANLPVRPVFDGDSNQVKVSVQMPGGRVQVAIWKVLVGRISLYLLDTNLIENDPSDRAITGHLYGGDMETRIKQEIILGIGGMKALEALSIRPEVYHMNEGHSAFLVLEHIRRIIEQHDLSFDEARQFAAASHVFTTHTPVPAGIDRFPPEMIQRYFKDYHPSLKLDMEGLLALGRENVYAKNEFFSMAVLAIRTSDWINGVSQLHANISRHMWQSIWPGVPDDEVPITHVTNGVHARSWLSGDLINLLDRYLGSRWQNDPADHRVWQAVSEVPDEELWRVHERQRHQLVVWVRRQLHRQLEVRGASPAQRQAAVDQIGPDALTIGFARRFATYKRGVLFLHNLERLMKLLADTERPVQFIIAGKAHPADEEGKDLIRQITNFAQSAPNGHKVVFVENYDINIARHLVQGCDVWLNNPRRSMEASGTSGMKAAINGVLNCSIMDGWWDEAYQNELGWQIGRGEEYANPETADDIESRSLYDILETQIIPMFYERDENNVPRRWIAWMKKCIGTLAPLFNTNRMLQEYAEHLYLPAIHRARKLGGDNLAGSIAMAHLKNRLRAAWGRIRIENVEVPTGKVLNLREPLEIMATVSLAGIKPAEVRVQVFVGRLNNDGQLIEGKAHDLAHQAEVGDGQHRFAGSVTAPTSGRYGFAVRVVAGGEMFFHEPGLICWESRRTPVVVAKSSEKVA